MFGKIFGNPEVKNAFKSILCITYMLVVKVIVEVVIPVITNLIAASLF
jgi:hypothetical protein